MASRYWIEGENMGWFHKLKKGAGVEKIHQMHSFLIWNVRGLNGLNKQKEVKILRNKINAGIVGMVETTINTGTIERESTKYVPWMGILQT